MKQVAKPGSLILAGWSTRNFNLQDLADYLEVLAPPIVEISKDLLDGLSIKNLHELLKAYGARCGHAIVSFAGTTDLTTCAGLSWDAYFDYLRIQEAQARFLGSRYFRLFAGETKDFAESNCSPA